MSSRSSSHSHTGRIDKLDFDSHRKPTSTHNGSGASSPHGLLRDDESLLSNVVDGVLERDRRKMKREVVKYLSFASAILSCLCAGSITAYSVYGYLFQSRLQYTQFQVNEVSIAAELGMYLPVPLFGYLCDRYNPRPISLLSAFLFGPAYLLAAFAYHQGPPAHGGWPFGVMVLAFVGIGMGTSCMYLSAVTTCAKNFGRGKHKGLALAIPIAAFGLSGMWQSQVGSRLLYEEDAKGIAGDVDVFRFFLFLAGTLFAAGLLGVIGLRVVDEEELIDEAVEELERSGLLEESDFFQRSILYESNGYGTISSQHHLSSEDLTLLKAHEEEEERKKTWLLNAETRRFLADPTMWFLAGGFFLVTGPGEAFINNLGTIIGTLYPPPSSAPPSNSAATHVSIIALTSTCARLITGTLTDLLAPNAPSHKLSASTSSLSLSLSGEPKRFTLSRVSFLLASTLLLTLAFLLLASPFIATHPSLFPLVSALAGTGYGAVFSLTPILISVVWGVQNFGTNWGIIAMMPAGGAAVWGAVYSVVYQGHVREGAVLCFGRGCYEGTAWAMGGCGVLAMGLWAWAWRGREGWVERGIAV
ncbi:putative monocarboxylate transporter mch1 [Trapelia coarctata]|nr:putative monocarboxylate transporter mch1 [Trapelia coarctata]